MKCLILAGGSGDRMWPLSRKNYPKQFMKIKEKRSLLQETVVRNLPLCDEFLIVTNEAYHFIVEGQLTAFQQLRYRCFLEQQGRKTAAAIALLCLMANPGELFFVVSSDTIISGGDKTPDESLYREAVLRAKKLALEGSMVAFGMPVLHANTGYGYIRCQGEQALAFEEKPDEETARRFMESGDYYWNSGMFLFRAGVFLEELQKYSPEIYAACRACIRRTDVSGQTVRFAAAHMQAIPAVSVEKAVMEHTGNLRVVRCGFAWQDIGVLEDLENAPIHKNSRNVISYDSDGVTVVNVSPRRLVVANGIHDTMIVNTEDVTYIGKKGASAQIRDLMREHEEAYKSYFENNRLTYRPYGTREVLTEAPEYRVKKVVLYPGCAIRYHKHDYRSEHWSVVEGSVRITLGSKVRDYHANQSIFVPVGIGHKVENVTDRNVTIIEVAVGKQDKDHPFGEDLIVMEDRGRADGGQGQIKPPEPAVRLLPAYKDYLWGGDKLKTMFDKQTDLVPLAESWELSAHPDGQSVVADGRYRGMLFGEYLKKIGKEAWGWKCQSMEQFPILVKLLDAREALSMQVHPDDEDALLMEHEYGKNEMWYVLEAEEGACVYLGFREPVEESGIRAAVEEGTFPTLLRKIPVHTHDTVFVPAGCVHALGAGVVVCEVQQNSNSTYRLYDYDREDVYGHKRQLHLEKALRVLDAEERGRVISAQEYRSGKSVVGTCKYFTCTRYVYEGETGIRMDDASFLFLLFVEGSGTIRVGEYENAYKKGDSFFLPAGQKEIRIEGDGCCLTAQV